MLSLLSFLFSACGTGDQTFSAKDDTVLLEQGNATIEWSPGELVVVDVEQNITFSGILTVTAAGEHNLTIEKVDITDSNDGVFYIDVESTQDIVLMPGTSRDFVVIVLVDDDELHQGEVRVRSNDADNRSVFVPICTFPVGYEGDLHCAVDEVVEDTGASGEDDTAGE
jgi:hypothetical protein